jgi:uncharacterized protein (TIGR00645 family)
MGVKMAGKKAPAKAAAVETAKRQNFLEHLIEVSIFGGRWLLAPFYIGLLLSFIPLLYRFFHAFWHMISHISHSSSGEITLQILELLDTVLLGNLIIIVLFAGYENFVSKISVAEGAEDRPHWMGHVDYSGLKIKLIGSLVAISVIELLKDFMQEGPFDAKREGWRIGIHITFVISGVLFAYMDNLADRHQSER